MEPQTYTFYPKHLRAQAVSEAIKPGAVRREVAKRLNIDDQTIARWLREDYGTAVPGPEDLARPVRPTAQAISADEPPPPPPAPPQEPQAKSDNLASLRSELAASQAERDLLKNLLTHYLSRGKP